MKQRLILFFIHSLILLPLLAQAQKATVNSHDGQLLAEIFLQNGQPYYRVSYEGEVVLNKRYNRTNDGGNYRRTTDVFQLATAVLFQNPVQFFAFTPNNLEDAPAFAIDFMKQVPTTWEETVFIDGYPGKYVVLARKQGDSWYIAGIHAQEEILTLDLNLPMLAGKEVRYYGDLKDGTSYMETLKVNKKGSVKMRIQPQGGIVLSN